jgi:hypothetical protein
MQTKDARYLSLRGRKEREAGKKCIIGQGK